MLPRDPTKNYFSVMTLLMSNKTPVANTTDNDKVSQAGREYFYHAAKLQLRFRELL